MKGFLMSLSMLIICILFLSVLYIEIPQVKHIGYTKSVPFDENVTKNIISKNCSGRDSNPGLRLERPPSLAGLDDRSM